MIHKVFIVTTVAGLIFGISSANVQENNFTHRNELQRMQSLQPKVIIPAVEFKDKKPVYGNKLTAKELRDVLYVAGFRGQNLKEAWGVAMKESTGRPKAHNDNAKTGDNSYGLFQINMRGSLGPARREQFNLETNEDLFDPLVNAKIAFHMSKGGENWSAWSGITPRTKEWMAQFPD